MKTQGIISAAVLTLSATLAAPTFACSPSDPSFVNGILFSQQSGVTNDVGCGKYEFAATHTANDSWFNDRWRIYVSEDMTASLSVFDTELTEETGEQSDSAKIFDTRDLSFTVFEEYSGHFLGWAGENETLSGLSLKGGNWYLLKVYGNVGGLFGNAYRGVLDTSVAEVPLSDTAPLLGSALGLLALRLRKRVAKDTNV